MAPHSSTLAWKIPWTEEPGRLQSIGSWRVGHDWVTSLSLFTFMHWRRKGQPTPVFLPGESQGRGAWWAAVYGVTQSRTLLKRLGMKTNEILKSQGFIHSMWEDGKVVKNQILIFFKIQNKLYFLPWTLGRHYNFRICDGMFLFILKSIDLFGWARS